MDHSLLPLLRELSPLHALSPLTKTVKLTETDRPPEASGTKPLHKYKQALTKRNMPQEAFRALVAQKVTAQLTAYGTADSTTGRRQTNKKISGRGSTRALE